MCVCQIPKGLVSSCFRSLANVWINSRTLRRVKLVAFSKTYQRIWSLIKLLANQWYAWAFERYSKWKRGAFFAAIKFFLSINRARTDYEMRHPTPPTVAIRWSASRLKRQNVSKYNFVWLSVFLHIVNFLTQEHNICETLLKRFHMSENLYLCFW